MKNIDNTFVLIKNFYNINYKNYDWKFEYYKFHILEMWNDLLLEGYF